MRQGFRRLAAHLWIFGLISKRAFQSHGHMNIPNQMHSISGSGTIEGSPTSLEGFDQLFFHSVAIDVPNLLSSFKGVYATGAVELGNDGLRQRFLRGHSHAWSIRRDIR
jgi:hypothetical protein